jgi:hypothetical protein
MNIVGILAFGIGAVLIYSGIKNKNPADVVKEALGQKSAKVPPKPLPPLGPGGFPNQPPGDGTLGGIIPQTFIPSV